MSRRLGRDAQDGRFDVPQAVDVILHHSLPERAHVELIGGGIWIEPIVTERAVEGYSESMQPILRREPLRQAENKYRVGLPIHSLFGPIRVGRAG